MDENAATSAFQNAIETHVPAFETFFLAKFFGAHISYTDETCIVEIPVNDLMFNPQGSLHGGVIAFALDVSMGHLLNHTSGPGMTLEMKTQYLRPLAAGRARCEAHFLRRGRSINYLESRMTGEDGKLAAAATSTWRLLAER